MPARFDWPEVMETTALALVASRLFEPFIDERRERNEAVWSDQNRWLFGYYFGRGDTRLWVPRRNGADGGRVINFSHPLGRKAFRILVLAYGIGTVSAAIVAAAALGARW
ncbi:MAG: hypothetical protein JSS66_00020 [Armatimonadetes bacterium]|nr:hypothetical protein [Armatimonadota bacterium]